MIRLNNHRTQNFTQIALIYMIVLCLMIHAIITLLSCMDISCAFIMLYHLITIMMSQIAYTYFFTIEAQLYFMLGLTPNPFLVNHYNSM